MFSTDFLLASLVWGSLGAGFCVYGKKQAAPVPLVGGLALLAVSCLVPSPLPMSLLSLALLGGMACLRKIGY